MLKQGNSSVENCINNLLHCFRGEVPFERAKGINRKYVGQPEVTAIPRLVADTKIMLRAYETAERVDITNIAIKELLQKEGVFEMNVKAE